MNTSPNLVCRLCLKVPHNEFVLINETVKEVLGVLSVKMNLDICDGPLMCEDCMGLVKKSLSFKSTCLDSDEVILPFHTKGNTTDIDLREVYKSQNSEEIVRDDTNICRLCMNIENKNSFTPLDVLMKDNAFSEVLKECLTEMDLSITKDPVICFHCQEELGSYFKFLQKCNDTEDKINTYRKSVGNRSSENIMLWDVFQSFLKCPKNEENEMCETEMEIKKEIYDEEENIETVSQEKNNFALKNEELIIKDETTSKCYSQFEIISHNPMIYKCNLCPYKGRFIKFHLYKHWKTSEIQTYQCDNCEYQTKSKNSFEHHLAIHRDSSDKNIYQCGICNFLAKRRYYFEQHMLVHKDSSEVQMYQCDICEFKTKHRGSLNSHRLVHKDMSEVRIYQCDYCEFKTKHRRSFKSHQLGHNNFSDLPIYQCDKCEFNTIHSISFKDHLSNYDHSPNYEKPSEDQMYHCYNCKFQSKYKRSLTKHLLRHRKMYQCDNCEYQTKHKKYLTAHISTHKVSPSVQIYRCGVCEYQTVRKNFLQKHMLLHNDTSKVQMYRCDSCEYQTIHRGNMKSHMLVHKDSSEVQMYQCDSCEFKTKRKQNLKQHILIHKGAFETILRV